MKRIFSAILAVVITAGVLLTGCTSTNKASGSDDSLEKIKSKGEFVVGLDDAFPPMGFRDENGNIVGFDIDLANEAAKIMGVKVKFQPVVWENITMELNNNNVDVIWNGLSITEDRKKEMAFTDPYMEDRQMIVVSKGSTIKGKADLAGKKVGLQAGSSSEEALNADKETKDSLGEVVPYQSNDQALQDLKNGRVDAVVVDEVVGRYYISKHIEDYTILEDSFGSEEFAVGLRKNDKSFAGELNKALDELKKNGKAEEISTKWFGENVVK